MIQKFPNYLPAYISLAQTLERENHFTESITVASDGLNRHPNPHQRRKLLKLRSISRICLGEIEGGCQDLEDAFSEYQSGIFTSLIYIKKSLADQEKIAELHHFLKISQERWKTMISRQDIWDTETYLRERQQQEECEQELHKRFSNARTIFVQSRFIDESESIEIKDRVERFEIEKTSSKNGLICYTFTNNRPS